jgi:hypothetical protein
MFKKEDELALKVTKEIVVKFIEVGRLSVDSFDEAFTRIHETVRESLIRLDLEDHPGSPED